MNKETELMKIKLVVVLIIALIVTLGLYFYNKSNNQYSEMVSGGLKVVKIVQNATEDIRGGARVVSERGAISASDWKFIFSYFDKHEILFDTKTPEKYGYTGTEQEIFKYLFENVLAGYTNMTSSFLRGDNRMGAFALDGQYEYIDKATKGLYLAHMLKSK
jgi:hypothetical protein